MRHVHHPEKIAGGGSRSLSASYWARFRPAPYLTHQIESTASAESRRSHSDSTLGFGALN
jgi:hypothetical protein